MNSPPRLARKILLSFLRDDLAEEVLGDLEEKFYSTVRNRSLASAKLNYWYQVLNYIRLFAIRRSKSGPTNSYDMLQNYFKIGWRNLFRNKGYSLINIGGLAMGMAVAMLIGLWVFDELAFNKYHTNYSRIGRVLRQGTLNGETGTTNYLPYALADELKTKYGSNFKNVVIAWPLGDHILSAGDVKFSQPGQFIEPAAPEMFSFRIVNGTGEGLRNPNSILLSSSVAKALFGDVDPLHKALLIDNKMNVVVTGIYEDFPHNSHFHGVKFFAPWDLFVSHNQWMVSQGFTNNFLDIYVELAPAVDFQSASENMRRAILNNVMHLKDYVAVNPVVFLHPMSKWHLYSEWKNGVNTGGRIQFVWLFGIAGIFVLALACINFMNLSTARSEKRAKEVSIRKTVGSLRSQLISQFFSESFLIVFLAFIFAVVFMAASLPWFNELAGKQIVMPWSNDVFWMVCLGFIIVTSLLAGSYPALYLSSFQPVTVLKGAFRVGRFASLPRKVLVVLQFTVSVSLVIGTVIVHQQIQFAKNRPVGYTREGLVMVHMTSQDFRGKFEILQNSLKNSGAVSEMALSNGPVTGIWSSNGGMEWRGKDPSYQVEFATLSVTHEYGKTVGWQFLQGRDFSRERASDSTGIVITEGAARIFGFENPIGEVIKWKPVWGPSIVEFTIIGVINDMVMRSPYTPAMPALFAIAPNYNVINIKINPAVSSSEAIPKIASVFKEVVPSVPFDYTFADQEYALKFATEERIGKLATVFAVLAILISSLGLFGLASYVAEQRTKEIGIRKVVGASIFDLWGMLSKDFVALVLISSGIAIPIAYSFLSQWLLNYEYRTEIYWWIFVFVGAGAVIITLLTVSYQAIKAAMMNPVKSLRSE